MSKHVKLTLQQAEQVEWALGAMDDYWTSESEAIGRDGPVYPESALPHLAPLVGPRGPAKTAKLLILSDVEEINDDLLYRLEEQLPDMERQAGGQWEGGKGAGAAGINAAKRIRHAMKYS
jgi:hypothetical protein